MKLSSENYLKTIIAGIAILTSVTGAFFLLSTDFDGIEFNGDSHVYFLNAQHFSASISNHVFPASKYWPYGYPALLSLAFEIGNESYETARWVNVLFGGILAVAFCVIGLLISRLQKMSPLQTLLFVLSVGLLPMGHGLFLKYQLTNMSDITASVWSVLTLYFCWKWKISGHLSYIALTGIFLGLSVFTRYVNVLLLIPVLIVLLHHNDPAQTNLSVRKIFLILLLGISSFLIFAPQLYITLQNTSSSLGNSLLHDWSIHNFFTLTHESIDGKQTAKIPSVFYYFFLPFRWQSFTPFGLILIWLGIKYSFHKLPSWFSWSTITWYLVSYLLLCGIPLQNSRIGFPLFLPIVLWMALGILECRELWPGRFNKILWTISLLWIVSLTFSFKSTFDFIQAKNKLKATAETIAKEVPPGSKIISTSLYAVYRAYPAEIEPLSIYKMDIEMAKGLLSDNKPVFIAIDEQHFIPQWGTYPPGKCLQWIKEHYTCTFLYTRNEYTVYKVSAHSQQPS